LSSALSIDASIIASKALMNLLVELNQNKIRKFFKVVRGIHLAVKFESWHQAVHQGAFLSKAHFQKWDGMRKKNQGRGEEEKEKEPGQGDRTTGGPQP
jgi:hypothetical protein